MSALQGILSNAASLQIPQGRSFGRGSGISAASVSPASGDRVRLCFVSKPPSSLQPRRRLTTKAGPTIAATMSPPLDSCFISLSPVTVPLHIGCVLSKRVVCSGGRQRHANKRGGLTNLFAVPPSGSDLLLFWEAAAQDCDAHEIHQSDGTYVNRSDTGRAVKKIFGQLEPLTDALWRMRLAVPRVGAQICRVFG